LKNNNGKLKVTIFTFYLLGIVHWLVFFLAVDYYNYTNQNVDVINNILLAKNYDFDASLSHENKLIFNKPISIRRIKDNVLKRDKHLVINFINDPKPFSLIFITLL